MTTYDWTTTRTKAQHWFNNETPHPETEQAIIDAFKENPVAVISVLEQIRVEREQGATIRSCWAVARHRTQTLADPPAIVVSDASERKRRIRAAETFIHNAGLYIDREDELEEELFGPVGRLRAWTTDTKLRERMLNLWLDRSPAGEQAEREALKRHAQHVATRQRLAAMQPSPAVEEDPPVDEPEEWHLRPEPELVTE